MLFIIFAILGIIATLIVTSTVTISDGRGGKQKIAFWMNYISMGALVIAIIVAAVETVPAGHVKVATLFGKVKPIPLGPGMHVVNPLLKWHIYDCLNKTHQERVPVPSMDQLVTSFDINVQYRVNEVAAPSILQDTGTAENIINVHLIPKLRSILREQGKTVTRAEDFFLEAVQQQMQANVLRVLVEFLEPKGLTVSDVLLRNISLPELIRKGVEEKKQRDQQAEREVAELRRFETEQEKLVKTAKARLDATQLDAEAVKVRAEAEAFRIEKINGAIANNKAYIQLEALRTLGSISKDPAAKIYFMNGDSPSPLPLMHMGTK